MRKSISILFSLFFIVFLVSCEGTNNSTTLTIGQGKDVQLEPGIFQHYFIDEYNRSSSTSDLFIHIAPKLADPFQVPYLSIHSDKGYEQHCYNAHAQFAGICRIKAQDLDKYLPFILVVRCLTTCNLHIQTYLSPVLKLQVGSSIDLKAYDSMGMTEIIHVQVPETQYTSLAVMAVILNMQQRLEFGQQGIDLFVNYGAKDTVEDPNQQTFAMRGSSVNGAGKGVFLYRDKVAPKDVIRTYVRLSKGVKIKFTVIALRGDQFNIQLGGSYYDYASKASKKLYKLDTSSYTDSLSNKTIEIVFDVYSGNPQFIVSFTHDFSTVVEYTRQSSAVSIIISPETRVKNKFNNTLFIKVITNTTTQYYFSAQIIRDDAIFIQPYITYFDEIQSNQVQNYVLFERYKEIEGSTIQKKNISFKIQILRGKGDFFFKRCANLQLHAYNNPKLQNCFINSKAQLSSGQFLSQEIQNKHVTSGNLVTIFMPFDISQCNHQTKSEGFVNYLCVFDIIAVGLSSEIFQFSIVTERKYLTNYLREGKMIKQYIPKGNYVYYVFSLPEIDTVDQINIFLTAFSGDAALIISTTDKLPNLITNMAKQAGSKCNIVLKKGNITKQIYISVYAYQFTEINLGVIVHRSESGGSVHQIPLEDGNIQSYILNKTQPIAFFIIKAKENSNITVFINEILGHLKMTIFDQSKKQIKCKNAPDNRLTCIFASQKNKKYSVKVQKKTQQAKLSISYKTQSTDCFSGSLNHPLYVNILPQKSICYTFNLNREIDLEFTTSFTHLQILDKQIITTLRLNEKDYAAIGPHKTITLQNLNQVCQVGIKSGGFPKTCRVTIKFENKAKVENSFSFILQQQDADIALFDGVSERVKGLKAQSQEGKRFYYHVKSEKPIIMFFSTQSLKSHYYLSAKFINNDQFLLRNEPDKNIYPSYVQYVLRNHPQKVVKRQNEYTATLGTTGLQVISIDKEAIKEFCEKMDCYLVISVYPESYENNIDIDEDFYEIEVTQDETVLQLAQSKVGVVNKGDVYTYVIEPQDAVVELKYLNKEKCLIFEGAKFDGSIVKTNQFRKDLQVSKVDKIQRIFVKGKQDGCSFEISYLSNNNPYRIVRLSHPYQIQVQKDQFQRFIYYHQNSRTFKIAPMTSAGIIKIYVKPIKQQDFSLSSLSSLKLSDYPIKSTNDGQFTIMQQDKNYCSNCYYYILVTTQQRFVGQVVFLRLYDPIPLSTNHVYKEHLIPLTILGVQNYIYYSLTQFNVTFNILSGKIGVAIIDPSGFTVVNNDQISSKKLYSFKSMNYLQKEQVQLYSQRAKYIFRVNVIEEAQYYVEVKKDHLSERLFQGFPTNITFQKDTFLTVQFLNSQDLSKPLNLMIDIHQDSRNQALLAFTFRGQNNKGQQLSGNQLFKDMVKSDNTYILTLLNFRGRYYIDIKSSISVSATLILVKNTLTHIAPKENYLFNREGVYQIYSNYKKVMVQVFNCQGQLDLIGSKDERDMQQGFSGDSPIQIKRPNYGGHYVFSIQSQFASYFIKIKSKAKETPMQYLVNYYYYEDINPYESIDTLNYQVTYQNSSSGFTIHINPPTISPEQENKIKIKKAIYTAYLSNNLVNLNRLSKCNIEAIGAKKKSQSPSIIIDKDLVEQAVGRKGKSVQIYIIVQAQIQIQTIVNDKAVANNFPNLLTIYYNTVELSIERTQVQKQYDYWFTDSFILFIGWMALPFILSAVTLFYLFKCFMRKVMMRQAYMVEQIEIVASNQTVPTEQKIGQAPESGTQIVKQHI